MALRDHGDGYLTGRLLVAMPTIGDPRFEKTVIYLCAHTEEGAMGIVVNRLVGTLTVAELMDHLELQGGAATEAMPVHFGGPVESSRGFVLHSDDYGQEGTLRVEGGFALTATLDVLRAIAGGAGPRRALLALGYSGWGPGQLDAEIQANGWLQVPADEALVFDPDLDTKWARAMGKIGIDASMLSMDAGHA